MTNIDVMLLSGIAIWSAVIGLMAYQGPFRDWREAQVAAQHEAWFSAHAKKYTLPLGGVVWAAGPTAHMDEDGLYVGVGDEVRGGCSEELGRASIP